jgi:hypothetical protein
MTSIGSRNDRNVHNCRLKVGSSASVHKLTFTIEEALRLCSLPGEHEGRVYYFRYVHITGLPENGDRSAWLKAFQSALTASARNAVSGSIPHAAAADAVYFRNQHEACVALLERIICHLPVNAWFWAAVSESRPGASAATHVAGIVAKLSRSETEWLSVAAAVFASSDPVVLLPLIAESTARAWLKKLHREGAASKPVTIRDEVLRTIDRAARTFGAEDPRVIWFASMAIILISPVEMGRGAVVNGARALIEALVPATIPQSPTIPLPAGVRASALPPGFRPAYPVEDEKTEDQTRPHLSHAPAVYPYHSFGERTEGAGLYFLLNAMKHLRLSQREPDPRFLAHLLQQIAQYAGIRPEDPILLWTNLTLEQTQPEAINERAIRIWLRKLRRWCWRNGKIGLRAIVRRPGRVTLTSTDLDISLPIDSADIRIRRIGLDLDPGWLPWFGRAVHFHYVYPGELHG